MGKGNRIRTERSDERKAKKEAAIKQAKRQKRNHAIGMIVAIVLVAAIVISLAYTAFFKDMLGSRKLHNAIPAQTESYSLSAAQLSYFFNMNYISFLNQYGSYATYFGLDSTKDLADQACNMRSDIEGYTWYDYFTDAAKDSVKEMLVLCEAGKARGISLDDSDKDEIEHSIEELKSAANSAKKSFGDYIEANYGKYVTETDIRANMELQKLASKTYDIVYNEPTYTEDQITKECADNLSKYYFCDYKSLKITADIDKDADDDAKAKAKADAKAAAEKIQSAASSEDAFDKAVEEYYRSTNTIVADDAEDKDADGNMTESKLKENVAGTLTTGSAYTVDTDFGKWAFEKDGDTYVRKTGDVSMLSDEDAGTYTVYYMVKPMYRHDYATKNVRHLLITKDSYDNENGLPDAEAKAKAEELLEQFKGGSATEDEFAKLATENTLDEGSKENGGLYENVLQGKMVENFDNWIYNAQRKAGDTEVVSSDYGYHVMYFVGDGKSAWQVEAENNLRSDDYQSKFSEYEEKYTVNYYAKELSMIKQAPMK